MSDLAMLVRSPIENLGDTEIFWLRELDIELPPSIPASPGHRGRPEGG